MDQTLPSIPQPREAPPEPLPVLNNGSGKPAVKQFDKSLQDANVGALTATGIETFQINVGRFCNQTCKHCHVDAGPDRIDETMSRETFEVCLEAIRRVGRPAVDLTGGAPELNPNFRWFVEAAGQLGCHLIDRCNLTVLLLPSQRGLAEFLARHRVEVVASLPYFLGQRTDAQRGDGVFEKSIRALRKLNSLGYGVPGSGLTLNLVYNPTGAFLPPDQTALEVDFKRELRSRHGIEFNSLYTITNMPIHRFLDFLVRSGNYERYMERLVNAFNPAAAGGGMCRKMVSVGWDGRLHDCDFNLVLGLEVGFGSPRHIRDFSPALLSGRRIVTGQHCYGCTAGSGSSCGGSTV
ncbi:MAG: arsenosugar biosynthesis radical SAM protein ArsS [Bryobacterales bacterium]|nr:arsenosugar biosynthesis radical SAM protein ArsS [Bryobacterales bacterium]